MPVNINLLPDEVIARGVTPPDFSQVFTGYQAAQDRAQQQALQNLFSGGLPRDAQGNIDYNQMAEQLARVQGAGAIGSLAGLRTGDIQQQVLRGIGQGGGGVFSPPPLPQERTDFPPSVQRTLPTVQPQQTSSAEDERRLRPDQPGNLGEVTGVSVDGQPTEAPTARSFAPVASTDSRYPAQFQPPTERFTPPAQPQPPQQVAQAQPRPQYRDVPPPAEQSPIPPGSPGFYSLENATSHEQQAGRASAISAALGAAGLPAAAAGYKQQSDHLYDTAKQIREHLSKIGEEREKSRLQEQRTLPEAAAKAGVARLEKGQEKAETTAQGIAVTQDLFDQLNSRSGIFTGKWANEKLNLARIAEQLGYPIAPEKITDTQTFMSIMGQRVASGVKAFGSGTSITNQDREYVTKMVGGDITLDESSIRRILEITDKLNRGQIQKHNADVDRVIKSQPDARPQLEPFKVDIPPKIQNRTAPAKPAEQAQGKTWTSSKGNTYRINPDGSLAPLRP